MYKERIASAEAMGLGGGGAATGAGWGADSKFDHILCEGFNIRYIQLKNNRPDSSQAEQCRQVRTQVRARVQVRVFDSRPEGSQTLQRLVQPAPLRP